MGKLAGIGAALALFAAQSDPALSQERVLASDGADVELTLPGDYTCAEEAPITITTRSAAYFDQDAATIQRLANVVSAVLGFECSLIERITLVGVTDGVVVFRADAAATQNWAIQSEPAPLEARALLFSVLEPSFGLLGPLETELAPFRSITGLQGSQQYRAFRAQGEWITSEVVDGDLDAFRAYLENPAFEFAEFEQALEHFRNILASIEAYAPEQYPAYLSAYEEVSAGLKDRIWSTRVAQALGGDDISLAPAVSASIELSRNASSPEFKTYLDDRVLAWLNEQTAWIETDLEEAPLFDLAFAADQIAALNSTEGLEELPTTSSRISTLPELAAPIIAERLDVLRVLAVETVVASGERYTDASVMLETAFALAEEFELSGFPDDAQLVFTDALNAINEFLSGDLDTYKQELAELEWSADDAEDVQQQALLFEQLSADFTAFGLYETAAETALRRNNNEICQGVLRDARVNGLDFNKRIFVDGEWLTLTELTCDLFEYDHRVTEFIWAFRPGVFNLEITDADGVATRFRFNAENFFTGQNLRPVDQLAPEERSIDQDDWDQYLAELLLPPPSGRPDANGVRECDVLAADPNDPTKRAEGVHFQGNDDLDFELFERGIDACIAAVEDDPTDTHSLYQLGRILWYAGEQDEAAPYINAASEAGYASAIHYQAELLLSTSEDPDVFVEALELFERSADAGYQPARQMVLELNPDGMHFFREISPPTEQEILSTLSNRNVRSPAFLGITTAIDVVGVEIRSCFQTNATDFMCEYRRIASCRMSGGGNDPIMGLMNMALQADCNQNFPDFHTFRKREDGRWTMVQS
ncbi:SEL1-like repeat protein [Woodsholea maritima]|uniref:hypothetical protein n=1 Tax=Woodsholea maritima TaxID=240237 RepID=UPI00037825A7|nr:hypothetical protein [Woodsholea maritima]